MVARLRAPGWYRALPFLALGIGFAYAITIGLRAALGYDPVLDGEAVLTVSMLAGPMFVLVGLGAFDYWFYWAAGRPTRPEDGASHGATAGKDYFRSNPDHKGIRIQYTVTSFF